MTSKVVPVVVACIFGIFILDQRSVADDSPLKPSLGLAVGPEFSTWRESDQSGATLLRESGPRVTLSLSLDNADRTSSGVIYNILLHGYIGDEHYDGQTQTGVPVTSDTGYIGEATEITGGYRFKDVLPIISVDLTAALGADIWRRRISDTTTDAGQPVSGSEENYRILLRKIGSWIVSCVWQLDPLCAVRRQAPVPYTSRGLID